MSASRCADSAASSPACRSPKTKATPTPPADAAVTAAAYDSSQLRVLVRGATARDDAMTVRELERAGIAARSCPDVASVVRELARGAGALLLAEECLADVDAPVLLDTLMRQPPWSDLPMMVL